ncbi:conserved hypothetical protein [Salinibacter ruber M8]|uniref:DUF2480 family protein n=1 Tax=Salinibacter ruber (strain M8) TaxID=761659 RepID=D5HCR0_SALRM|nr:DUF2480 family protein [Salinibacter ruber]CBH25815.1 conserved hypothetical protein [Salinibacter ruber M8]
MESIENRVAQGEIEVYNLADLWDDRPVTELDISTFLVDGLMLKEKAFRSEVDAHDWSQYADEHVALYCSTDAIVPTWGYMLIASELRDSAQSTTFGRADDLRREYYVAALDAEDWSAYEDKPVVIKGCGDDVVPEMAYVHATQKLQGVAKKLMYGEPCSSVPLWRWPQEDKPKPDAEAVGVKKPDLPTPNA